MAYNSAYTGSQVDAAVGAVRQKETIWDGKQDELTGTEDQLVGFNSAGEAVAVAKPDPLPTGGETGQVLTKTASGTAWDDVPSDLPAGGTDGQILTKTADGVAWEDAASGLPDGGTSGQMLYQGANGPEWGDRPVLYVNITKTPSETSADKSYAQIVAAKEAGYAVFALYTPAIIPLVSIQSNQVVFSIRTYANERVASLQIAISKNNIVAVSVGFETTNAKDVEFSPASSGLSSTNVQDAIEEVQSNIPTAPSDIGALEAPEGGTTGQILEKTATGTQWADKPASGMSQSEADARYLQLSGGTMTGALALPGNPTSDNQAANKAYVDALKPTRLTHTLSASGWSGNRQTITVNGVITDTSAQDIDISCADKASADAWAAGGVWCNDPTQANRLTFTCTTPPTANINLNIRLWEVG